jgi:hypothetical protein
MAGNIGSVEGRLVFPVRCNCDADVAPTVYYASAPVLISTSLRFSLNDILFENISCVGGGILIV